MPAPDGLPELAILVFTAATSVLAIGAYKIWQHRDDTADKRSAVEAQEADQRDTTVDQIAELLAVALEETLDEKESPSKAEIKTAIEENVPEHRLTELAVVKLGNGCAPSSRFEDCLDYYKKAYQHVGLSALGTLSIPVLIVFVSSTGADPFTYAWDGGHAAIGFLSAMSLYSGIDSFNRAQSIRDELF